MAGYDGLVYGETVPDYGKDSVIRSHIEGLHAVHGNSNEFVG